MVRLETVDGDARPAVVRDASESGVFLLTHGTALEVGDTVELQLVAAEPGEATPRVRGRVVRAKPWEAGDLWRLGLGIRFDGKWSPELVLAALAPPPIPPAEAS